MMHGQRNIKLLDRLSKNTESSDFVKIHLVGAELLHTGVRTAGRTDRKTDTTKLIVAIRNFAIAPKTHL